LVLAREKASASRNQMDLEGVPIQAGQLPSRAQPPSKAQARVQEVDQKTAWDKDEEGKAWARRGPSDSKHD
jgi:hypothetical protein